MLKTKKQLKKAVRRKVRKVRRGRREIRILRTLRKMLRKLLTLGLIGFAVTFLIYMFNLENKLIYKVIYPFLQKHYDSQTRDRRI